MQDCNSVSAAEQAGVQHFCKARLSLHVAGLLSCLKVIEKGQPHRLRDRRLAQASSFCSPQDLLVMTGQWNLHELADRASRLQQSDA